MKKISHKNLAKLQKRTQNNALRRLKVPSGLVDFSSNDYLGFAKNEAIFNASHQFLIDKNIKINGATGSRLLSGNHLLYTEVEAFLSALHETETATVFNSGYDANIGFFSSVPQRGDVILFDEFIHASIRDGILLSNAKAYKFKHNNVTHLHEMLQRVSQDDSDIYVVTESVFSMDGDTPSLIELAEICKNNNAFLVVDEAHALGVFGTNGCGLVQHLNLQNQVFARIVTFGKALGCHGAAILGSNQLQQYLVNFARSFIYTTGLPPHSLATIKTAYTFLNFDQQADSSQKLLQQNISFFKNEVEKLGLKAIFIESNSAIFSCVISGNEKVKGIATKLQSQGFDVKAILSPTVPKNQERLRFCLHSYNSKKEITEVLCWLTIFVNTTTNIEINT